MTPLFEDHLSLDAVVAFADGELSLVAYQRAAAHLERCPSCAAEVAEQTSARECLRHAGAPQMPGSLFDQLRSIPIGLASLAATGRPGRAPWTDRPIARVPDGRRDSCSPGSR